MVRLFNPACFLWIVSLLLQASSGRSNDTHGQLSESLTAGPDEISRDVLQRRRRWLSKKNSKKSKSSKSSSSKKKHYGGSKSSSSSKSDADGKSSRSAYGKGDSRSAYGNSWSKSTFAGEAGGWSDAGGKDDFAIPSQAPSSSPPTESPTESPRTTLPTASPAPTCLECDDYPYLKTRSQAGIATTPAGERRRKRNQREDIEWKVIFIGSLFLLALAFGIIIMAHEERDKMFVDQQPVQSDDETSSEASSN